MKLNWRDASKELPVTKTIKNMYLCLYLHKDGNSTFQIAPFDGKNFWIEDENYGSVNIQVTHWLPPSELPLPLPEE